MSKPKYWNGTVEKCDVCNSDVGLVMYDARIPGSSWANMCRVCFKDMGCKLGTGNGQEYTKQSDDKWLKTGG